MKKILAFLLVLSLGLTVFVACSPQPDSDSPDSPPSGVIHPLPEPEDTEPEDTEPEDTEPEDTEPEDTEPEDTEPEDTEPEDTEPEDTEPEDTEPEDTEPEDTEPEDTEPDPNEPKEPNLIFEIAIKNTINSLTATSTNSSHLLYNDIGDTLVWNIRANRLFRDGKYVAMDYTETRTNGSYNYQTQIDGYCYASYSSNPNGDGAAINTRYEYPMNPEYDETKYWIGTLQIGNSNFQNGNYSVFDDNCIVLYTEEALGICKYTFIFSDNYTYVSEMIIEDAETFFHVNIFVNDEQPFEITIPEPIGADEWTSRYTVTFAAPSEFRTAEQDFSWYGCSYVDMRSAWREVISEGLKDGYEVEWLYYDEEYTMPLAPNAFFEIYESITLYAKIVKL